MRTLVRDITNLFFPPVCLGCAFPLVDNEEFICTQCRHQLPLTHIHNEEAPTVEKIFYGRVKVEKATAMLWFEKQGIVQHMIHQLKYKGHEELGAFLGHWLGWELSEIAHYKTVNAVVPVPLHPKKYRKRGYNQVAAFGKAIAQSLQAEYMDEVLVKKRHTRTQTYKNRLSRWSTLDRVFSVSQQGQIAGKHILLVDDVITTGATMEACINELQRAPSVKISVAAMALAV